MKIRINKTREIEEGLGIAYGLIEQGEKSIAAFKESLKKELPVEIFAKLENEGYVKVSEGKFILTPTGEVIAKDITRRHRLAERLFSDVLEIHKEEADVTVCEIEHIISADVTDAICTLLGHPKVCPHGFDIPQGQCCLKSKESAESIVVPLNKLDAGERGRIAYILTQNHPHLHKLLSFGLVPGTDIVLHQSTPSFIIKSGETQLALDRETAAKIYIRNMGDMLS